MSDVTFNYERKTVEIRLPFRKTNQTGGCVPFVFTLGPEIAGTVAFDVFVMLHEYFVVLHRYTDLGKLDASECYLFPRFNRRGDTGSFQFSQRQL
ncbi:hypothetical protein HDV05_008698 [Chytridiales sp. JEL 0842]|nr:hypothetical protein HDV05_008698 [Chytridiales sp. JEL 0842]